MKNKVWTPSGYLAGPVNSLVGKGESIINYDNGTGTLVTKGKIGVDNLPSSVTQYDDNVIAGNDIDWSNGMKFSDLVAPLTAKLLMYNDIEKRANKKPLLSSLSKQTALLQNDQLDRAKAPILQAMKNITDRLEKQHLMENYVSLVNANRGMDRFDDGKPAWKTAAKTAWKKYITAGKGKVSNQTIDLGYLAPAILEGKMLNHWMKEQPKMPGIYAPNKYAPEALLILNKMRVDPYNLLQANRRAQNEAYYRIQQNGGYSGGLRQLARIALAANAASSDADIFRATDLQNNQYRSDYAKTALQVGEQDASRRQQANQYGWEAYNKAHGAKTKGIETHLANLGLIGQKWLAQRIKNKQYGDVLDMYQQDLDLKKATIDNMYGAGGKTDDTPSTNGTGDTTGIKTGNSLTKPMTLSDYAAYVAQGWTPSGYSNLSGKPNIPYLKVPYSEPVIDRGVMDLKYGDHSLYNIKHPFGKYPYVDADKTAAWALHWVDWGNAQEDMHMAKYGTPYDPRYTYFMSDKTGGFGSNGLYQLLNLWNRIAGSDSQEVSKMRFNRGKGRRR